MGAFLSGSGRESGNFQAEQVFTKVISPSKKTFLPSENKKMNYLDS